ncbi:hypothetical protein VPNG_06792 [Cytospora leucostoma]|uniref:Ecp2 effector protein domain-containing protein n=1 Tax=Cytospora leucostoma TaxID=1230097 RepID=A0A423WVW7_9PEZI|nr:hypothetical protein VPNG_06792 [Cytospora leucostoma]
MPSLMNNLALWLLTMFTCCVLSEVFPTYHHDLVQLSRTSAPVNVTNNITWATEKQSTDHFCEWHSFNTKDDSDCDLDLWDCYDLLTKSSLNDSHDWFEVSRQWDEGHSTSVKVASMGTCIVQVAMINGTNAAVSVLDIADKLNRTIQAGLMEFNIPNLRPSYGTMWCPGPPPNKGRPLNIGVEWMIDCSSEQITVSSFKKP